MVETYSSNPDNCFPHNRVVVLSRKALQLKKENIVHDPVVAQEIARGVGGNDL